MIRWFWLSYADPDKPEGEQFLGVVIIPVDENVIKIIEGLDGDGLFDKVRERGGDVHFLAACGYSSLLGKNPGGEVQGIEITNNIEKIPLTMRGVLLDERELASAELIRSVIK